MFVYHNMQARVKEVTVYDLGPEAQLSNLTINLKVYFVNHKNPKSQFSRKESYRAAG